MVIAIGIKADHIFPGHRLRQTPSSPASAGHTEHAFGRQAFAAKANLEYKIFCKFLWEVLKKDMGQVPTVGWKVSPTYGPIYLFQERYDKKRMKTYDNDGHPLCDGQWHSGCLHNMLEMAEGIPRGSHHQGVHRQNAAIKLGGYHA